MNGIYGVSPAMTAGMTMADKSKGSMGNRIDCAAEQTKNILTTNLKATGAGLAIGGTTYALGFTKTGNKVVEKATQSAKGVVSNFIKKHPDAFKNVKEVASGALNKFKALPKAGKIALAIGGALATIIGGALGTQQVYKAGQIDQKYTDKAQLQEALKCDL